MSTNIVEGASIEVRDPDGGTTRAKVIEVREGGVKVKWLEARWNLNVGSLMNRKGTTSFVAFSTIV